MWKSVVDNADWTCWTASQLDGLKSVLKASLIWKKRYLDRMYENAPTMSGWCLIWQKHN